MWNRKQLEIAEKLLRQGVDLYEQNMHDEAIRRYEAAKTIYTRLMIPKGIALTSTNIGLALEAQGKPGKALRQYEAAKTIFGRLNTKDWIANVETSIGHALVSLDRPAEAMRHYEAAKTIFKKLNLPEKVADVEMNIGNILVDLGEPAEAMRHYEAAKIIYKRLEKKAEVGFTAWKIGLALHALGRRDEAIRHLEAAKTIYDSLEMKGAVANVELLIGVVLSDLGRLTEAIRHSEAAKTIYDKLKMLDKVADVEMSIGATLADLYRHEEAIKHYEVAKTIFERLNMEEVVATVEVDISTILCDLNKHAEAIRHYEAAKTIFERLKDSEGIADIERIIGDICLYLGEPAEAIRHYEAAKTIYKNLKISEARSRAEMLAALESYIAIALIDLGKYDEAMKRSEIALRVFEDFSILMGQAIVYRNTGLASIIRGNLERALHDLNRSFKLMERIRMGVKSPDLQRSLKKRYVGVADALCAVNLLRWQRNGGSEHLDEALNIAELAKCSTVAESLEAGGGGVPCPEAKELVIKEDQLLNKAQQSYRKWTELRKLRLDEEIDRAEFRTSLADLEKEYDAIQKEVESLRSEILWKCADVGSTPIPRTYNVLKKTLEVFPRDERWAILEFVLSISLEKLLVFLVDQEGSIHCVIHDIDLEKVTKLISKCQRIIKEVRKPFKRKKANEELDVLSKKLYNVFIPVEIGEALKSGNVEHLIVVPHKLLHWVPFEILFDGNNYWGIKYALSTAFSLDLARLCVEKRKKRAIKMKESLFFLLVKNPLFDLTFADEEVNSVLGLLEAQGIRSEVLHNDEATQLAFIEAANTRPFNVLHYAGHAMFMGKHPSLSHLDLHTDGECPACSLKPEEHTPQLLTANEIIHDVKFKRTPIVYLSGCESGVAEVEAGDEMFGLVRALMYAGATSLVLSRWLVRDKVAPVFAEEFCRRLLDGESVAVALRNARLKVFNLDPLNFTDWAVFSLQGDPFRRLVCMHVSEDLIVSTVGPTKDKEGEEERDQFLTEEEDWEEEDWEDWEEDEW